MNFLKLTIEQDIGRRTIDRTKENKKYCDDDWKQNHHLLTFQAAPLYPSPYPISDFKNHLFTPLEGGPRATYTSNLNNSGYSYAYGYGYEYVLKLFLALVTRAKKRPELYLPKRNYSTNPQKSYRTFLFSQNYCCFVISYLN